MVFRTGSEIVARPHMHTFMFKDGVRVSDLETVQSIFYSFAAAYGLTQPQSSKKKDSERLRKQINNIVNSANFIAQCTSTGISSSPTAYGLSNSARKYAVMMHPKFSSPTW